MAPTIYIPDKEWDRGSKILNLSNVEYSLVNTSQVAEMNTSDWIAFPDEFLNGKYSRTIVSPGRISYNSEVERVGKEIGLNLKNTSKDSLGREFVGNINHSEALKINLLMGNNTPDPKEFLDLLNLLYQGANEKIKVYNFAGKQLGSKLLQFYFDDIVKV